MSERTVTSHGWLTYVALSCAAPGDAVGAAIEPASNAAVAAAESAGSASTSPTQSTSSGLNRGLLADRDGSRVAPATVFVVDGGINVNDALGRD